MKEVARLRRSPPRSSSISDCPSEPRGRRRDRSMPNRLPLILKADARAGSTRAGVRRGAGGPQSQSGGVQGPAHEQHLGHDRGRCPGDRSDGPGVASGNDPPALPVLGALIGYAIGRRLHRAHCSDPDCQRVIAKDDTHCAGCGGLVAGRSPAPISASPPRSLRGAAAGVCPPTPTPPRRRLPTGPPERRRARAPHRSTRPKLARGDLPA